MPIISDRQLIQSRLEKDRIWSAYAMADLEEGYFEHTTWFCDAEDSGLTLLYRAFSKPLIVFIERSGGFASVLGEIDNAVETPDRYLVVRPQMVSLIRDRYRVLNERPMVRMTLDRERFAQAQGGHSTRLGPGDTQAIRRLYAEEAPEFFQDSMLKYGIYFGIYEGPELVSVAGTHINSENYGIGGVGNIYTRLDRRSRGYASRSTSAVCSQLIRSGIMTILLNVREDNAAAIRVYERLGFQPYCRYLELVASAR